MTSAERSRKARLDPEYRRREREAEHRYNHSFRGVVRQYRYKDKQALARLEQQVKEGMESL